jgi:hypothetical protein
MPRRPFGVWFSIALVLLIAGSLVGWEAGKRLAVAWHRHERQRVGTLTSKEREHMDAVSSALSEVMLMRLIVAGAASNPSKRQMLRQSQIEALNRLRQRNDLGDIKPILDLNLAADEVLLGETNPDQRAQTQAMQSARELVQSLGWKDSSDSALEKLAKRENDFLTPGFIRKVEK